MDLTIRPYEPLRDARRVLSLWHAALANQYPASERVFLSRAGWHPGWEPGDGLVALAGRRLVGFALGEIVRTATGVAPGAFVSALLVHPAWQRRGLGSRLLAGLEQRARRCGCRKLTTGAGPMRFFTGVPEDLAAARAFFAKHGYGVAARTPDMIVDLERCPEIPRYAEAARAAGVRILPATPEQIPAALAFETREFAGWCPNLLALFNAGDHDNVLLAWHGDAVIGSITCFTPGSRWLGANLVWEAVHGPALGGYGAVGIAAAWRGRGLGAAMSQEAAQHVRRRGARRCYIDWVGPVDFYRKLGAEVWRWFEQYARPLA